MASTIFVSAGEASGEHYGALLVAALKRQLGRAGRTAEFYGMGSSRMEEAGLEVVVRSEDMAVMGITEVLRHLPRIYREFGKLKQAIRGRRPDVAVLIDFPDIHFRLAEEFHRLGVPIIFFVSPQLWAWKKHRIKLVQKYIDRMLTIFPFEEQFYRDHGVEAEFVGHPLAELALPTISREQFARDNGLNPERTWIGLLPGSRLKEIRDNLPEILRAAVLLAEHCRELGRAEAEFVLPLAPMLSEAQRAEVAGILAASPTPDFVKVTLVDDARAALFHARASVVASGTATVEAALIGNPFVVVYRVSAVTYAIAKRVVKVPHVAMANLIAGKRVVPELIQADFTAANIVQQIEPLLPDGVPRQSMMEDLKAIRGRLNTRPAGDRAERGRAVERVAEIVLAQIGVGSPAGSVETGIS
jgi:lipid-A-disaccharide synthase